MQLWYCYFFLWTSAALGAGAAVFFEPDPMGKAYLARTSSGLVTLSRESIIWPGGMRQTLVGGRTAGLEASGPDGGASFYYLGSDPTQWRQKVPHYRRVRQAGVYPGIDVEFYGKDGVLEFDWMVGALADPRRIVLKFEGASKVGIEGADLVAETAQGRVMYRQPRAYQGKRTVEAAWEVSGIEARLRLGEYDHTRPLVIDPETYWLDRLGGGGDDEIAGAFDYGGTLITVGHTNSPDLQNGAEVGAKQTDILITGRSMTSLGQETTLMIIGGRGNDRVRAVANFTIAGETDSIDFPVIGEALQRTFGGGKSDGFLVFLNNVNFGGLRTASYFGGSGEDRILSAGGGWFAGETNSPDLPVMNAPQSRLAGGFDGMFGCYSCFGNPTVLSYWGGEDDDRLTSVQTENGREIVRLGGRTRSRDFPVRGTASAAKGGFDGVLAEWSITAQRMTYSAYWGGPEDDGIVSLASLRDFARGEKWALLATTRSPDMPVTNDSKYAGGDDAFLEYRDGTNRTPTFATYFGGSGNEAPAGLNVSVTDVIAYGATTSTNLPMRGPAQGDYGGGETDGWWSVWSDRGAWVESSYWGGTGADQLGYATRPGSIDSFRQDPQGGETMRGEMAIAGTTSSLRLPGTAGRRLSTWGGVDGFFALTGEPGVSLAPVVVGRGGSTGVRLRVRAPIEAGTRFRFEVADPSIAQLSHHEAVYPISSFWRNGDLSGSYRLTGLQEGETTITVTWAGGQLTQPVRVLPLTVVWSSNALTVVKGNSTFASFAFRSIDPATGEIGETVCVSGGAEPEIQVDERLVGIGRGGNICGGGMYLVAGKATGTTTMRLRYAALGVTSPPFEITVRDRRTMVSLPPPALSKELAIDLRANLESVEYDNTPLIATSVTPELLRLRRGRNWFTQDTALSTSLALQNGTIGVVGMADSGEGIIRLSAEGVEPVFVRIPLRPHSYVMRPREELILNNNYSLPGVFTSTAPAAFPWSASLWAVPIPRGVNPHLPLFYEKVPGETWRVRTEIVRADGQVVRGAPQPFSEGILALILGVEEGSAHRVVDETNPDPEAPLYRITARVAMPARLVILGHQLETTLSMSSWPVIAPLTVESTDPRVLLSKSASGAGQSSVDFPNPNGQLLYVISQTPLLETDSVRDVRLNVKYPGLTIETIVVRLVPAAIAFQTTESGVSFGSPSPASITIGAYAVDPFTRDARIPQKPRRGGLPVRVTPMVSGPLRDSGEVVLTSDNPTFQWKLEATAVGDAELTIRQPQGFLTPTTGARARVKVTGYQWQTRRLTLAPDTVAPFGLGLSDSLSPAQPEEVELTSEDPSRLLLSLDPLEPGQASIRYTHRRERPATLYLQALPGSTGTVNLLLRGRTTEPASLPVSILPLRIRFRGPFGSNELAPERTSTDPDFTLQPMSAALPISMVLSATAPEDAAATNWQPPTLSLRPGAVPLDVRFTVEGDSGILPADSIQFRAGDETRILRFVPLKSGESRVVATNGEAMPIRILVDGPRLLIYPQPLGTQLQQRFGLSSVSPDRRQPASFTVTSEDAGRLLLAADETSPGRASLTVFPDAQNFGAASVWVQALGTPGNAAIRISAEGFPDLRTTIPILETVLRLRNESGFSLVTGTADTARLAVEPQVLQPPNGSPTFAGALRAGTPEVQIPIVTSTPGVIEIEPAIAIWRAGQSAARVVARPVAAGSVEVKLGEVPGFRSDAGRTPLMVAALKLSAAVGSPDVAGRYRLSPRGLTTGQLWLNALASQAVSVRVESLDPAVLQVRANSGDAPHEAIELQGVTSQPANRFFVSALVSQGEGRIRVSAPGVDPMVLAVDVVPIGLSLDSYSRSFYLTEGPQKLTLRPSYYGITLPVGPPIRLTFRSSDAAVASVEPESVEWQNLDAVGFTVTPRRPGKVAITIAGADVATTVVNLEVLEAQVLFQNQPSFERTAQYAQKTAQIVFAGGAPKSPQPVTVTSSNPALFVVSAKADTAGGAQATATVGPGLAAAEFAVQALAASGSGTVTVSSPGYGSTQYRVSLMPVGVTATNVAAGRLGFVLCELSAAGDYCSGVRATPQMPPVAVEAVSSDTTVLVITDPKATANVRDQSNWGFPVRVLRNGTVRIQLTSPLSGNPHPATIGVSLP